MSTSVINGDDTAYVPEPSGITVIGAMKSYDTYADFIDDENKGAFGWVDDASGDPTVDHGGAMYRVREDGSIQKIMEQEAMDRKLDYDVPWAQVTNKPLSAVDDIDSAVNQRHTHSNMDLLNLIAGTKYEASFNSYPIITTSNFGKYLGKYLEDIEGSSTHVHTNLSTLNSLDTINNRLIHDSKAIAYLSDIDPTETSPYIFPADVSDIAEMDVNLSDSFIFQGSSGYIRLKFKNVVSTAYYHGFIKVGAGTAIIWPKGNNDDDLCWCLDKYPEDMSIVTNGTKAFVYEYRIISNTVYLRMFGTNNNLNVEE